MISGARVLVLNLDTGIDLVFPTNEAGLYYSGGLLPGRYRLRCQAKDFASTSSATLTLNAGTAVRVDFHLRPGEATETIEVTTSPSAVNTQDGRLSATVDPEQIANLPLNGRSVYDLVQYVPGAVNVRGIIFEKGANTVVNGVRENFNGFLLNGVANTGLSGGPVNQPIQDTVEEFQVLTLNNSAQFGNNAGSITSVVTKSGTNSLHGSAWEFVRNNAFDANSYFANNDPNPANRKQSPLRLNQFGGTMGGPIIHNRLFFFAAYQGDRFITSSPGEVLVESPQFRQAVEAAFPGSVASLLYSSFPADTGRPAYTLQQYVKGNYSGSGFTSFAQYLCPAFTDGTGVLASRFARLFGVQQGDIDQMNQGGCAGGSPFSSPQTGTFARNQPFLVNALDAFRSQTSDDLFNGNEASVRVDYDPNAENRFFAQFNWAKSRDNFAFGEVLAPRHNFVTPSTATTPNFQFSFIRVFSPTTVNEFRAGYTSNLNVMPVSLPGVPAIAFDDGTVGFGSYSGYPQYFREHTYSYSELVSLSRGKHLIKIGGDVRRNLQHSESNQGRPSYSFFDPLFFALDSPYGESAGVDPGFQTGIPSHLATNIRHFRNW
ncbi:MAG TPA: carboxypeptidase regulatory-like domain-containing protein, partial [Terriglobales bacterium]